MPERKTVQISELGKVITGKTPKTKLKENYGGTIPFLTPSDEMKKNKRVRKTRKTISEKGLSEVKNCIIPANAVCVSCIGTGLGEVVMTTCPSVTNQQINSIIVSDEYDSQYVYYAMCEIGKKLNFISKDSTAVPIVNKGYFSRYKISIPEIGEQKRISSILSSLDDKIELNRDMNENLEKIVKLIFEREVGRYIRKKSDKPDWKTVVLEELVECIDNRGKTPPLSETETEYPIIDVKSLKGDSRILSYRDCVKHVEFQTYKTWFRNGTPKYLDIVISTVGSLAEMKIMIEDRGCIAQNVVGLRSKEISAFYLYEYLKYIKAELESYDIGSVQPSIKLSHILKYPIILADDITISRFSDIAKTITTQISKNCAEIERLENIRDELLPRLISGEILPQM